jgi:arylsulfatase A-like enzyme
MTEQTIGRRAFLKLTAAGTATMAIPGCAPRHAKPITTPGYDGSTMDTKPIETSGYDEAPEAATEKKPNILFIYADELRADVCSVYGGRNINTPNIGRLASGGVVFTNSVSSCPLCTPYRGMLQTGRYPTHSGIIINYLEVDHVQNPRCMADAFRAAGYETGYIGKWHLTSAFRREEGVRVPDDGALQAYKNKNPDFDYVAPGPSRLGFEHWQAYNCHLDFNNYWYYEDEPVKIYSGRFETDVQTDQAIAYMEKYRQSDRPFFLTVATHPPHPPWDPEHVPEGYLEQVPEKLWWAPNVPADIQEFNIEMQRYLAMTKNVDDNLGRLLDYLEVSGLAKDTIVVFTSDHGEMYGSHRLFYKMIPYSESINIPLIIRWPKRIRPGARVETLQTPMDHFPTLCGLAGLPIPQNVDGVDLSGVLLEKGGDGREEVLIGNYVTDSDFCTTGGPCPEWRGVKTKQYTYWRWLAGNEELYDNLADPYQMENLAANGALPEALVRLRSRLSDLLAAAHDDFTPGTVYGDWFKDRCTLIRTGLGPVSG